MGKAVMRMKAFWRKAASSSDSWMGYLLLAFLAAGFVGCMAVWYRYAEKPGWNEDRRKAYEMSKDRGTVLDEGRLEKAMARFRERKEVRESETDSGAKDIFRLKDR